MAVGTNPWLVVPIWTNANQPTITTTGMIGFNLDDNNFEGFDGSAWVVLSGTGGGGGGGDNITVNGVAVTDANFNGSTPAAPSNAINVTFQRTGASPTNVTAHLPYNGTMFGTSGGDLIIADNGVNTTQIADSAVTFAKMQLIATGTLLGRHAALTGPVQIVSLNPDVEFSGGALRVVAFTGDVTKTAGGTVLTLGDDTVKINHLAGYSQQVITATGATAITIPTDAQYVRITCVGNGGNGGDGVSGNNTANRLGGRGGGSGGRTEVTYRSSQLPNTLNCWVGAGGAATNEATMVQSNTTYTGGAVPTTMYSEVFCYASGGAHGTTGTGAGGTVAIVANMLPVKQAVSFNALSGSSGTAPIAGTPTAIQPFGGGASTSTSTTPGSTGAGKTTTTAFPGQNFIAMGTNFPQINGGAIATAGAAGQYHGGQPINAVNPGPANMLFSYGGMGGGSSLVGVGGAGGAGALGSGGGGGGAGLTGGAGGAGGNGFIIVETW